MPNFPGRRALPETRTSAGSHDFLLLVTQLLAWKSTFSKALSGEPLKEIEGLIEKNKAIFQLLGRFGTRI